MIIDVDGKSITELLETMAGDSSSAIATIYRQRWRFAEDDVNIICGQQNEDLVFDAEIASSMRTV